jgi:hypothetical protein
MPTHVVYIDDSGTKEYAARPELYGTTGCSRYFVFGGVLLSTVESGRLVDRLRALKLQYFNSEGIEIKSNWLRIPREREQRYLKPHGIDEERLRLFVEDYYSIIAATDVQLIASVVDKVHVQEDYPLCWYAPAIAYDLLMQRVVQEVRQPNSVSVIVDDMTGKTPKGNDYKLNLSKHHNQLRQKGSSLRRGLSFAPLAGDVRFVNSAHSHQIQVADVMAYNVYRQFVEHGDAWEVHAERLPTYEWFDRLGGKIRQAPNGRVQGFGIVKFPLRKRVQWIHVNDKAAP